MKRTIFILSILLICYIGEGQGLLVEGKLWSNTWIGTEHGDHYHSYFIKFSGDTVLHDRHYKKILKEEDPELKNWEITGFIREDDQKVYLYDSFNKKDTLLYDFGLDNGDSILVPGIYAYVDTVVYETFGDSPDSLKQILFHGTSEVWIKGLGSTFGVLEGIPKMFLTGEDRYLVCYYENDTLIYHNDSFSTCFPTGYLGVKPLRFKGERITVSTADHQISFHFNGLNTSQSKIFIYDLNGTFKDRIELNGEAGLRISVEKYKPGLYIYIFKSKIMTLRGKFIVMYR